ncbi:MAG TPA: MBL fold metallo-hydrolase [Bacteroidales bacterium]|nr:MBL fold metallo-hydrolase [Bacteroidales bacterium]HPS61623.1 MBL fold metallo-hydrolase [Bacteroidales bacterium]
MQLYPIHTGNLKLDGGAMFGVVPKVLWSKAYPCDENNLCNWAMRCLLVVEGDRRVLIDCGIGDKQAEKFFANYHLNGDDTLEKSLAKYGFTVGDITDLILTHLHFDHAGGAIRWNRDRTAFERTFPNAVYHVGRRQWEWATHPNNREKASFLKENILPMAESGRLGFIDGDGELIPGIGWRLFDGHTDGQVIPFIRYRDKTIVYMADLLPSAAHIPLPWLMSYDTRPLLTLSEKEKFMTEAAEKGYVLFFEHDLFHECCTVELSGKGVRFKESFPLDSI